jgi:hypothetical protein
MADDRPNDWAPLVEDGSDPVPGDWELVKEASERYRQTADAIERARTLLQEVTDSRDGWQSEAGEAFREKATELSDDVFQAYGRYDATAEALADYWPELEYAQEESLSLRRQAINAQDAIDAATTQVEAAEDEDSDTHDDLSRHEGDLELAQGELQALRDRLAEIVDDKDTAAQRAADAIGEFIGNDGLEDGFWDRMGEAFEAFQDVMAFVGEIAGQIAMIAGVASLLLCWVPVLGQALAAIATIATAVSLLANVVNGDWHGALLDTIGLATFGVGRAVGAAARVSRAAGARSIVRSVLPAVRGVGTPGQRLSMIRSATGLRQGALTGMRQADEAAALARNSPLGYGAHAFRNAGQDLASSLRAPFNASNWSVTANPRQMLGLTDMAGVSTPGATRAAVIEGIGIGGGTASGLVTHDQQEGFQPNAPIGFDGDGFPVSFDNPFSDVPDAYGDLPGVSSNEQSPWSAEAAGVGEFR